MEIILSYNPNSKIRPITGGRVQQLFEKDLDNILMGNKPKYIQI